MKTIQEMFKEKVNEEDVYTSITSNHRHYPLLKLAVIPLCLALLFVFSQGNEKKAPYTIYAIEMNDKGEEEKNQVTDNAFSYTLQIEDTMTSIELGNATESKKVKTMPVYIELDKSEADEIEVKTESGSIFKGDEDQGKSVILKESSQLEIQPDSDDCTITTIARKDEKEVFSEEFAFMLKSDEDGLNNKIEDFK